MTLAEDMDKTVKQVKKEQSEAKKYSEEGVYVPKKWPEIRLEELKEILSLTIKEDDTVKKITFLAELLTFTENDQVNLSFNGPSSSGKSYIPLEIALLFPREDVIEISYSSPTAFWHSAEYFDEERKTYVVDLERKILIFVDQPHPQVLERMRSLLSHDKKEVMSLITDRAKSGGNRAKRTVIRGFCTAIFASASLYLDEQEQTRFLLLSPEITKEKMKAAKEESLNKAANRKKYLKIVNTDPERISLIERIKDIKAAFIKEIIIHDSDTLLKIFNELHPNVKARHSRDVPRIASFAKAWALLNLWNREYKDGIIKTTDWDLLVAFDLWNEISLPQELGVPPYLVDLYRDVLWKAYQNKKCGLSRKDIQLFHYKEYDRHLPEWKLRQEILPMLETSGLLTQEYDKEDKRRLLIYPKRKVDKDEIESPELERLREKVVHIHPPLTIYPGTKTKKPEKKTNKSEFEKLQKERDSLKVKLPHLEGTEHFEKNLKRYEEIVAIIGDSNVQN